MKNLTAARDAVGSEEPIDTGGWSFYRTVDSAKLIVDSKEAAIAASINFRLSTLN
jgi:hypothetical protein